MEETIKTIGNWIIWIAGLLTAVGGIRKWVVEPLRDIKASVTTVEASIATVTEDVGDILCDRLNQAHDHWVAKGHCPKADKTRLVAMHHRYTDMGRNHLTANYENDLLRLPEHPPDRK